MRPGNVPLLVRDFKTSFLFYRDVLGFAPSPDDENDVYAGFDTGGALLALFKSDLMAQVVGEESQQSVGGRDKAALVFGVEDVDEAVRQFQAKGVTFVTPPRTAPSGASARPTCETPKATSWRFITHWRTEKKRGIMCRHFTSLCLLALICASSSRIVHADSQTLSSVDFLVGDWSGGGDSDAGRARGVSSIKSDLSGHVLVRRDHTEFPAAKGQPASSMDALMLIYASPTDGHLHATYTDSGGHAIQYAAARVEPGHLVEFDSDASPHAPTFRLTYTATGLKGLKIRFEMAAPGAPTAFHPVAVGTLRRSRK